MGNDVNADSKTYTLAEMRALLLAEQPDAELWRLCVDAALIEKLIEKLKEQRGGNLK